MNEITELELVGMLMFREFHFELADIEKTESDLFTKRKRLETLGGHLEFISRACARVMAGPALEFSIVNSRIEEIDEKIKRLYDEDDPAAVV